MKFNAATLLPMILSVAAQVNAECKPGKTEEVVPGYNVEYGCNTCRTGNLHCSIDTIEHHKQCIGGDESGENKARSGIYNMKKLADDPSPEDDDEPFPADCESNKEACESDKADLDAKLKDCEGKRSASAFSFDSAKYVFYIHFLVVPMVKPHLNHNSAGPKNTVTGFTLPECIDYCSRRSWCGYALFRPTDSTCNNYKHKVAYTLEPGVVSQEWKCAVKK
ncbi:Hypothetical protein PENO1_030510 [Penicillium occitanis (nom. inval.)]|nr:hypothetical protein PENOC_040800 [Penicillium occitanis (nom. inval.)]PCH03838.1 Hypothetical protein PENO1_030510 [Penicillium occitanis (nom. inval.)]